MLLAVQEHWSKTLRLNIRPGQVCCEQVRGFKSCLPKELV